MNGNGNRGGARQGHIYKVAIYGRPSSGKTCIVAAMAMARPPHPDGIDCVWVCDEATIPRPKGDRNKWDASDPDVARYLGKEKLRAAIAELERGGTPPPNALDTPFRYLFDFALPDGRTRRIELMDYSGELVDPDMAEDKLARRLLEQCYEADGLLVLAEATATPEQETRLSQDLQKLKQAFVLIAERRRSTKLDPIPIALVIDKWDRISRMERYSRREAEVELSTFLARDPQPPHKTLENLLTGVAGSDGDVSFAKRFALSAFGKFKRVTINTSGGPANLEVPAKVNPLLAYGMEDPFLSVCELADRLEGIRLKRSVALAKPYKVWQLIGVKTLKLARAARNFGKRFPAHLPQAAAARALAGEASRRYVMQWVALTVMLLGVALISTELFFAWSDGAAFRRFASVLDKPINLDKPAEVIKQLPELEAARTFLTAYHHPSWYRFVSRIQNSQDAASNKRWQDVEEWIGQAYRLQDRFRNEETAFLNNYDAFFTAGNFTAAANVLKSLDSLIHPELREQLIRDFPARVRSGAQALIKTNCHNNQHQQARDVLRKVHAVDSSIYGEGKSASDQIQEMTRFETKWMEIIDDDEAAEKYSEWYATYKHGAADFAKGQDVINLGGRPRHAELAKQVQEYNEYMKQMAIKRHTTLKIDAINIKNKPGFTNKSIFVNLIEGDASPQSSATRTIANKGYYDNLGFRLSLKEHSANDVLSLKLNIRDTDGDDMGTVEFHGTLHDLIAQRAERISENVDYLNFGLDAAEWSQIPKAKFEPRDPPVRPMELQ